ncbi:MAG: alpha amylase C-terminal domain-containing protein [Flavobacteriaceae bacterium]|jgi:1,4-alpha-glucan branching enzyme|nr:alpha amylase C-terminal domain-containing protein [Flavobacteriaceae bacterium]
MQRPILVENDPYLVPFESQIKNRFEWLCNTLNYINHDFGSLDNFASAYRFFGFNYDQEKKGYWFRDWLPNAFEVFLVGDFNQWNDDTHPLVKTDFGIWEIFFPDEEYQDKLVPFSRVKLLVKGHNGTHYHIPAYIRRVMQNEDDSFDGQFLPESNFKWTDQDFRIKEEEHPIIYETHIGMATEEYRVGTYLEFTEKVLPRIKDLGYNTIQLMAIQEHPYYGSFGYQVSNFFAPSSRFGTPDELRHLINEAHKLNIAVILDVVHSHSVSNRLEGLAEYDGTEIYFNGDHPDWGSKLFDYGKIEVKRFLCSNVKYWLDEFHFDGFRFDGVTSMLYYHHGRQSFNDYNEYFNGGVNNDAILYLQLANTLIHHQSKEKISICEDMSGMPGSCRPVEEGGIGFDYRLAMGIPDYWTKLLETTRDEDWQLGEMYWRLTNRRFREKNIGYCESHDQALVGDKTMAFWLMDKEMYTGMSIFENNFIIDRGIALHKIIRFITLTLGGEGYLNFMGNEFGHPEWIDFPREGNGWSYHYARRQWTLPDADNLKYSYLNEFDKAMVHFAKDHDLLGNHIPQKLNEDNHNKVLIFHKNGLIFIFNFGNNSIPDYQFYSPFEEKMKVIFSSDDALFGGFERVDKNYAYQRNESERFSVFVPSRTSFVLAKI